MFSRFQTLLQLILYTRSVTSTYFTRTRRKPRNVSLKCQDLNPAASYSFEYQCSSQSPPPATAAAVVKKPSDLKHTIY